MAKADKITKKANLKKDLRAHVSKSLEDMFREFETVVGKRKFKRSIKKASKALITSIKPEKLKTTVVSSDVTPNHGNGVVPTSVSRVMPEEN